MELHEIVRRLKELEDLTDGNERATFVLSADGSGHIEIGDDWDFRNGGFTTLDGIADDIERNRQNIIEWLSE